MKEWCHCRKFTCPRRLSPTCPLKRLVDQWSSLSGNSYDGCLDLSASITPPAGCDVWLTPGRKRRFGKWVEMLGIWGGSKSLQATASSTQPPALLLAPKPAVKGQSILCCLLCYLPFLLAKIPHWPPVRFFPPPLNSILLLQMRIQLCLCVGCYLLINYQLPSLGFFYFKFKMAMMSSFDSGQH